MHKTREIILLDHFTEQFGEQSYLGPWLRENRDAIVADIRNDLPVDIVLPAAARRQAERILSDARDAAKLLRAASLAEAEALRAQTQRQCDQQRQIIADLIRRHAEEAARALARL
jgi:cell division septum initiation protein DivIVA